MDEADEREGTILQKLRSTLAEVETLRQDKELALVNLEELKESFRRLEDSHTNLAKEYDISTKEKEALVRQNEESVTYWKKLLEGKTRENEELRNKGLQPKEIEILRLRLTEEIEEIQKKKWIVLSSETERYRDQFYRLRRECELQKEELAKQERENESILREIQVAHSEEIAMLEGRIEELKHSLDSMKDTDRARELHRENTELLLKNQALLIEIEEIRSQRETERVDYDQKERLSQRRLAEEISNAKTIEGQRDSLQGRIHVLEADIKQQCSQNDVIAEENRRLEKELTKLMSRMEELVHNHNIEISDMKTAALKERANCEHEASELRKRISEFKSLMKNSNDSVSELKQKMAQSEREMLEKVRIAKEEEWVKISALEAEKTQLENAMGKQKQQIAELEGKLNAMSVEYSQEASNLKKVANSLEIQNDELAKQIQQHSTQNEKLSTQIATLQAKIYEMETDHQALKKDADSKGRVEQTHRDKITSLEASIQSTQSDLLEMTENLEKERQAYHHNIERYQSGWSKERGQLQSKLDNLTREVDQLTEKNDNMEQLVQKQQALFKSKIAQYKAKVKELKTQNDSLRSSIERETQRAASELQALRGKQTEFLALLHSEGVMLS